MNAMTNLPVPGGSSFDKTTLRARLRAEAFCRATGALIDSGAAWQDPCLAGCHVAPHAEFVVAATCCSRPMRFPEAQVIAEATRVDMVLLRFDADRGTSFDVLLRGSERWLCHYRAWRRRDGDLWLIPTAGESPFIRASAWGLEQVATPPFDSAAERAAGIIHAIDAPFFEGSL